MDFDPNSQLKASADVLADAERSFHDFHGNKTPPQNLCWSEIGDDGRLSETTAQPDCELRIEELRLRGPAEAALAFRNATAAMATVSRIPTKDELYRFLEAQLKNAGDAKTEFLDCTKSRW